MGELVIRWSVGLAVSLFCGWGCTRIILTYIRKRIAYHKPAYAQVPSWLLGLIEGTFFTVAVAFCVPGVLTGMIAWIAAKMAAHWNAVPETEQKNLAAVRFSALIGGMVSMFFAMIGGLICGGIIPLTTRN